MITIDRVLFDDLNHAVRVACHVDRIVSLCPSITETLFSLDCGQSVVGRTRYCSKPEMLVGDVDVIGGTKDIDINKVLALKPNMVMAVKEENDKALILEIAKSIPVFVFDVKSFGDAMRMILTLGKIMDQSTKADSMVAEIEMRFASLHVTQPAKSFLYVVWKDPLMLAGRNTFIDSMMTVIGLNNVIPKRMGLYPTIDFESCSKLSPELVILPDEPYPFNEEDKDEFQQLFPKAKILTLDGQMSSWYGVRMLDAANYLKDWSANFG